jgi:hypothetical protein
MVVLWGAAGGCAGGGVIKQATDPIAGCYQFERNEGAQELNLPWGFELLAEPLPNPPANYADSHRAFTWMTATQRADSPFAYWRILESGIIQVGYPGRGAYTLSLERRGEDLVGRGRSEGDAVPLGASADRTVFTLIARRVQCAE